jgi:two-component system CheB/CheR fusion protein
MSLLNLEGKRILVVEDDDMSYILLSQIFKLTKGEILRAKNGREALLLFRNDPAIDLVLMDIQLPDINGKTVTSEMIAHNNKTPIIAQTAGKSPQEIDAAIAAGCSYVLIKPFKMEELMEILKKYLH